MGKFKFITNFGLSVENLDKLKNEIIFLDIETEIQSEIDKIELNELMSLYLYCLLSSYMLKKDIPISKLRSMMEYDLLYPFLKKNQDLLLKYKKQDEVFEDEEDFSTIQAGLQQNQNKRKQSNKFEDYDEEDDCVYDFPDLDKEKNL